MSAKLTFHEHSTLFQVCRSRGIASASAASLDDWTTTELARLPTMGLEQHDPAAWTVGHRLSTERRWTAAKRPYYSVYPFVADSLVRLPLDIDGGLIRLPLKDLLVRFAHGHELDALGDGTRLVRSLLVSRASTTQGEGLVLMVDFGESYKDWPIQSYMSFALAAGQTVEESLRQINYREQRAEARESEDALTTCVRLACTICLLGDDPSMVTPDVLDSDRRRYEETHDPALISRAIGRGKRGWLIGAKLECDPHYRRPHLGLRWTGHGRTVPRIVPIKGAIVHRQKLVALPQGRIDDEQSQAVRRLGQQAAELERKLKDRLEEQ